jgi:hypothetical protein
VCECLSLQLDARKLQVRDDAGSSIYMGRTAGPSQLASSGVLSCNLATWQGWICQFTLFCWLYTCFSISICTLQLGAVEPGIQEEQPNVSAFDGFASFTPYRCAAVNQERVGTRAS